MKHAASRELYAYWEELRGQRPAPERAEIEPGAIRHVLSEAFILALDDSQPAIRSGSPARGSARCSAASSKANPSSAFGTGSRAGIIDLLASSPTNASARSPA